MPKATRLKSRSVQIVLTIFIITAYLTTELPVQAKIDQSQIDTFYLKLYNYKFHSADSSLQQILLTEKDPGIIDLLQITYQWWLIISGEKNPSGIVPLLDKIDQSIASIENDNPSEKLSQERLLQLIVMYSYKSRVHNLEHSRLSSYTAYKTSLDYFEQLIPCERVSCDMYSFVAGMYYSLGGYIKKEHPSFFFLGFDTKYADQQKGFVLLSQGVKSENLQVQTESIYFFMKLYFEIENNPDVALKYSEMLIKKFPDNLVFRYNQIQILQAQGLEERLKDEYKELVVCSELNRQISKKQQVHFIEEYSKSIH